MSKERLESLKRNKEWTEATGEKFYTVDKKDYEWLIKQAERAQELEQQNKRYQEYLELIRKTGTQQDVIEAYNKKNAINHTADFEIHHKDGSVEVIDTEGFKLN